MKRKITAVFLVLASLSSAISGCTGPSSQPAVTSTEQTESSGEAQSKEEFEPANELPAKEISVISDETIAKTQQMAATLVSDYSVPSVQYAIISNGEIILSGGSGYADQASQTPVTRDTMYCIGSISKMYTVCATMMLVDQGLVDLDTPLVEYIPEFRTTDERYVKITPRMLLNYSSGLYGTQFKDGFTLGDANSRSHDELLEHLAQEGLKSEPGEISFYCNDGITLLEILVERISGQTFSDYIRVHISEPLGLKNTYTPMDDFDRQRLAQLYHPLAPDTLPADTVNMIGSGGIYSTAEEVCLVGEVLMGHRPEILSAESALAMHAEEYNKGEWNGPEEGFFAYGLGWDSVYNFPFRAYDIQAVAKGGSTLLSNSSLVTIPEHNLAMAVASSGGSAFYNNVFACSILQEVLADQGVIEAVAPVRDITPPAGQEVPEEFMKYSGTYGRALYPAYTIEMTKDGFTFIDPLGLSTLSIFSYIGDNKFANEDGSLTITFETGEQGSVYVLLDTIAMLPGIGQSAIAYNAGQKIEGEPLSDELAGIWEARAGQYFVLDDAPASQLYMGMLFNFNLEVEPEYSYAMGCRVIDENKAVNCIDSPMFHVACNFSDLEFITRDGIEYMKAKGYTLIGYHNLTDLDPDENTYVIGSDNYARWYKIPDHMAGRQITVRLPAGSSFTVYDKNHNGAFFSVASGMNSAVLPEGGTIAFIGTAGDEFGVTYTD